MDSTTHEMKVLTRDQVLSMHHLLNQLRAFENLPYHVSGNDVSEITVLIVSNEKFAQNCVCLLLLGILN